MSLAAGLEATRLAYKAARITPTPGWAEEGRFEPVLPELQRMEWNAAILSAMSSSGNINQRVVGWTIAAALAGAASNLVGLFG